MTRLLHFLFLSVFATGATAEVLVASRTIRSQTILTESDLVLTSGESVGALVHPVEAVGLETRVILYAGQPIRADQLGHPALVTRNGLVALSFAMGGLSISAEGRALGRAALGEAVEVMNVASRNTITGVVIGPGQVRVGGQSMNWNR